MNLGSANLKTVNCACRPAPLCHNSLTHSTASRPQLGHSDSKRSVAASDDYYSFSDYASEHSSGDDQKTIKRYKTPPTETQPPHQNQDLPQQEPTQSIPEEREPETTVKGIRFDEKQSIPRKPVPADNMKSWRNSRSDISPPTPGVDDTPYIQFAIDQLTRDEELLGRRRCGIDSDDVSPISSTERLEKNPFDDRSALRSPEPLERSHRESSISPVGQEGRYNRTSHFILG